MNKKIITICLIIGLSFTLSDTAEAKLFERNNPLIGRWELCSMDGQEKPNVRQKVYVKDSYIVLEVDKNDNTTYIDFVGKISHDDDNKITETVIYTDSRIKHMRSRSFKFSYKVEGQYLYLKGIDNVFNETWMKVSE
jgi:hypothetical protein